jgi:hypothetical protein
MMNQEIQESRANFTAAKDRLTQAFATTSDDRINWSPSATARTPVHLVAHAAGAVKNLHNTLDGRTFPAPNPAVADKEFLEWEQQFSTREQVLEVLEKNSRAYLEWLDALDPERLDTMVKMPFGFGELPMRLVLTFQAFHMQDHTSQLVYLQTIYGDRDWHI